MPRRILAKTIPARTTVHERRLLPEGRLSGPMPWVIAIMLFLTVVAAAAGLLLTRVAYGVGGQIAGRVTIQVAEPSPVERARQVRDLRAALADQPYVARVAPVDEVALEAMLGRWLGDAGIVGEIPVPALIDVDLVEGSGAEGVARLRAAARAVAPDALVEPHADWLGSVARLIRSLGALAAALMLMMVGATVAVVSLATRGALNMHYATIEILHLIGSTDRQIARLFQRRIAIDAAFGCAIGFLAALIVILGVGWQFRGIGAGLAVGGASTPTGGALDWLLLAALPLLGVGLAMLTARGTITRALRRIL